jgi:hypothetical protein
MQNYFDLKFSIKNFYYLLPLITTAFFSCSRNLYLPSVVYAPQLRDKQEGEAGVNGNGSSGLQAQASFALTNHFGIQAQANAVSLHGGNFSGGANYRMKFKMDERNTFLIEFSGGYSCGTYKKYHTVETGAGTSGITAQPGYILYDLYGRWHGGYFQYSIGARLDNKLSAYTGTRFQFLNCEGFRYNTQFFAKDSLHDGQFLPQSFQSINTRHGFTTLAEVFLGINFGWQHFHFFLETQFRSQFTGGNLNDTWKPVSKAVATAGITFMFGNKNLPEYHHGVLVE